MCVFVYLHACLCSELSRLLNPSPSGFARMMAMIMVRLTMVILFRTYRTSMVLDFKAEVRLDIYIGKHFNRLDGGVNKDISEVTGEERLLVTSITIYCRCVPIFTSVTTMVSAHSTIKLCLHLFYASRFLSLNYFVAYLDGL